MCGFFAFAAMYNVIDSSLFNMIMMQQFIQWLDWGFVV
jgi:hypothetical protein